MYDGTLATQATARFSQKREAIVAAATEILNQRGVKGMTLAQVAERVGLITTSVTYYFKKKDELAAACFMSGIERLVALVREAKREPTATLRVKRLIELYIELMAEVSRGEAPAIPVFSDIRTLSPETHGPTASAYGALFRAVRSLFAAPGTEWLNRGQATARTTILLEQINWLKAWLSRYDERDYPRVAERMHDILTRGIGVEGAVWAPTRLTVSAATAPTGPREAFLLAATRLINQRGYHGASVELISAQLNVTKGSFYHHHNAKDDVVVACFERSFDIVRRTQMAARNVAGDEWAKLSAAAAALVAFQLSSAGPLLRTTAFTALPEGICEEMIAESGRLSDRFAAMIADGVSEGSIRPVDPVIAAHMLNATLNAAADLRAIMPGLTEPQAVELYARPFFTGLTER